MGFLCLVYSCTNFYLSWHTLVILFSPADQSVSVYCTRTVLFCTTLDFKLGENEGSNQEGESHFILTQFDLIFLHPVHLTSIFCITICLLLQFVLFFEVRDAQRCNNKKTVKIWEEVVPIQSGDEKDLKLLSLTPRLFSILLYSRKAITLFWISKFPRNESPQRKQFFSNKKGKKSFSGNF